MKGHTETNPLDIGCLTGIKLSGMAYMEKERLILIGGLRGVILGGLRAFDLGFEGECSLISDEGIGLSWKEWLGDTPQRG